jgi:hypothetical protein
MALIWLWDHFVELAGSCLLITVDIDLQFQTLFCIPRHISHFQRTNIPHQETQFLKVFQTSTPKDYVLCTPASSGDLVSFQSYSTDPLPNLLPYFNPLSLLTAKNVKLHNCTISLSVGLCPAGGGNAPRSIYTNFPLPSSYVQLHTSVPKCALFVSILSHNLLYAFFTFPYTLQSVQNAGGEVEELDEQRESCNSNPFAITANCQLHTIVPW